MFLRRFVRGVVHVARGLIQLADEVVGIVTGIRDDYASGSIGRNPVVQELEAQAREQQRLAKQADEARQRAEQERERAREDARKAAEEAQRATADRLRADEAMRKADTERRRAEENSQRAEQERRRMDDERMRAEQERHIAEEERRRAEENARRTEEERWKADQAKRSAEEEARRADDGRRRAEEDRLNAEQERQRAEQAQRAAENERRAAEEDVRRSEAGRARADKEARNARNEQQRAEQARSEADKRAAEAQAALEEAEKALREGVKPVLIPTPQEIAAVKKRLQYREGIFHFAVAGVSGCGKSSLINAFRGLRNSDRGPLVARTGIVETTSEITRFADPNPANPFAWYDVPGAGTLKIPDWVYFNDQGLYIFDCIIVLTDNRFTQTDEAILRNCARFNIPAYIVRSKSLQQIQNVFNDMPYDEDEEDDEAVRFQKARDKYITDTRESVARNLEDAGLPHQKVYMVDKESLISVAKGKQPQVNFDEWELMRDLFSEARRRRVRLAVR